MRSLRPTRFTVLVLVPSVLAACGGATDDLAQSNEQLAVAGGLSDPPIAATTTSNVPPPIVNGSFTTVPNWVVNIEFVDAGSFCSGWVLNEHWLLTAAHCTKPQTNGEVVRVSRADGLGSAQEIYDAPAVFFHHPLFQDGQTPHDVGLVHLSNQGLRTDLTGVAKMYSDTRRPWVDSSLPPNISAVGWGFSTPDPNDSTNCLHSGGGTLRTTTSMTVDVSGANPSIVTSPIGLTFPCSGDSGAPWLLQRGDATTGMDFFGFAVHGRRVGTPRKAQAAPLDDNRDFIENTITQTASAERYGAFCHESTFATFHFRQCEQIGRGWGQLKAIGKCMLATSATPGSAVTLAACNQTVTAQVWGLLPTGEIQSSLAQNLCLEAGAANTTPHVATCNNGPTQRFGNGAQGQLPLGSDFHQCVAAVPDPVATTGTLAASAPSATLSLASTAVKTSSTSTAVTTTALTRPCIDVSCLPKVTVKACDGGAAQNWAWGTF